MVRSKEENECERQTTIPGIEYIPKECEFFSSQRNELEHGLKGPGEKNGEGSFQEYRSFNLLKAISKQKYKSLWKPACSRMPVWGRERAGA